MADREVTGSIGVETYVRIGQGANAIRLEGGPNNTLLVGNGAVTGPTTAVGASAGAKYLDPTIRGYVAQVHPIEDAAGTGAVSTGQIQLSKIWIPQTIVATNVVIAVGTAIAGGPANCFQGLYTSAGVLIGTSADQSVPWATAGPISAALVGGPFTITGGASVFVWGAILVGTGTTVQFARKTPNQTLMQNAGLTAATVFATNQAGALTGQTSLAAFTPSSNVLPGSGAFWMAIS